MTLLLLCFLLGCLTGLRSLTPPAAVCWAAHLGWLHFEGTKLAFLGHPVTLIVFTLLALAELIADKLPSTPARTAPLGLIARIVLGCLVIGPLLNIVDSHVRTALSECLYDLGCLRTRSSRH